MKISYTLNSQLMDSILIAPDFGTAPTVVLSIRHPSPTRECASETSAALSGAPHSRRRRRLAGGCCTTMPRWHHPGRWSTHPGKPSWVPLGGAAPSLASVSHRQRGVSANRHRSLLPHRTSSGQDSPSSGLL